MTDKAEGYSIGDWIVHVNYGIGQVNKVEEKPLDGETINCFRVETETSVYWIPVDQADNPRIRSVATNKNIKEVKKVLKKTPTEIDDSHRNWRRRIRKVKKDGSLIASAELVRDLTARNVNKLMNHHDELQALRSFTHNLAVEWSLGMGIDIDTAETKLNKLLHENIPQVE